MFNRGSALVVGLGVAGLVAAMGVTASPADAAPKEAKPYDSDGNGYSDGTGASEDGQESDVGFGAGLATGDLDGMATPIS